MTRLYIIAGVLFLIGLIARSPSFKGWVGEMVVHVFSKLFLNKRVYHVIKNVTLPTEDGTTQIDHVIVSRFGVFVIETKNMNGAIYGSEHDAQWTQAFGKKKFRFQNPLRQNYKHTMTLADLLGVPHEKMISAIMFIGDARLKTKDRMPPNVLSGGFIPFVKSHRQELLTEEEVARVLATIEERRLAPGFKTHREHVQHVREIVARKEQRPATVNDKPRSTTSHGREQPHLHRLPLPIRRRSLPRPLPARSAAGRWCCGRPGRARTQGGSSGDALVILRVGGS